MRTEHVRARSGTPKPRPALACASTGRWEANLAGHRPRAAPALTWPVARARLGRPVDGRPPARRRRTGGPPPGPLRALPSVDEVVRALDGRPRPSPRAWSRRPRAVLDASRRAVLAAASAEELDARRGRAPRSCRAHPRRARRGGRLAARPRDQRDRRGPPHEPRPRARSARRRSPGWRSSAARYSNLELDVRTKERGSRYEPRGRAPAPPVRRRGLPGRQQQRRRRAARPRVARAGPRGRGLARRADRDRRRVPHPRHHGPVGGPARRGRDHEPDAARRLRERDRDRRPRSSSRCIPRTTAWSASRRASPPRSWRSSAGRAASR